MIDTIKLVIHDCLDDVDTATGFINRRGANSDVYNELFRLKGKSEYKSEHPLSPYLPYSITVDEVRERSKAKHHSKPKHNPSSTYKIIYNLDPNYGKITAEFSLPKYIYGTNIIQSVENVNEKDFTFSTDKFNIDHHVKDCYDRFYKMINQYFKNEFPLCKIDFTQIEITRIDLCFNHIFETKTDAFAYLDLMKESKRNYQRSTHPTGRYETSFMHVSGNDYSFKAYLKGPEYARDDAPEHRKINKLKNKQIFDVDFLQQTADKIIRYEITCRRQYFDYHHNFKLNRKNSREHSLLRKIFTSMDTFYNGKTSDYAQNSKLLEYEQYTSPVTNETWSVPLPISIAITELEKIEEIANKYANHHVYGSKSIDFISLIFTKKLYDHLTEKEKCKLMRDFHTRFRKLLDFSRIYTLTIDQDDKRDYLEDYKMRMLHPSTVFTSQKKVPFGKDLLESLCYKLFDLIGQIQVSRRMPIADYVLKINTLNQDIDAQNKFIAEFPHLAKDKKLKKQSKKDVARVTVLIIALQSKTLKQIKVITGMSERTFYENKELLKSLGLDDNTRLDYDLNVPTISYENYYHHTLSNQNKYFIGHDMNFNNDNFFSYLNTYVPKFSNMAI